VKIDRKKVDEVMATQGITPKIVAERLGVSQSVLSGMWNGKRDSRVATVHKIADALRVKAKEIVV
jgi:DNA-binding Xre family transcriptional regulator